MPRCLICHNRRITFFVTLENFTYCQCKRCKTLFLHPLPSEKQIIQYYKNDFNYVAGEKNEQIIRRRARIIIKNLLKLFPEGKTLLDVGSGYGFFLDEAKKFHLKINGVEPSKKLFASSMRNKIIPVQNFGFEHYYKSNKHKRFDFITVTHVIEHIRKPKKSLRMFSSLLTPGGVLYIETPNLDSHLFAVEKYQYTFLTPPDHIFLFSKFSFFRMIRNISVLKILNMKTYSSPEHFMGIVKRILKRAVGVEMEGLPTAHSGAFERALAGGKSRQDPHKTNWVKKLKYIVFDKILAVLLYRLLNIGDKGSVLELYIKKT